MLFLWQHAGPWPRGCAGACTPTALAAACCARGGAMAALGCAARVHARSTRRKAHATRGPGVRAHVDTSVSCAVQVRARSTRSKTHATRAPAPAPSQATASAWTRSATARAPSVRACRLERMLLLQCPLFLFCICCTGLCSHSACATGSVSCLSLTAAREMRSWLHAAAFAAAPGGLCTAVGICVL